MANKSSLTVRDIARKVNVSHTMVSRALNANCKFSISAEKREMIVKAARELGYEPNNSARALATGKSGIVALQLYDMNNAFSQQVARQFWSLLRQNEHALVVHEVANDVTRLRSTIDGTIMLASGDMSSMSLRSPVVEVGTRAFDDVDCVYVDLKEPSLEAMAHLVQTGRRRIALVSGSVTDLVDGRTSAYIDAMESAQLPTILIPVPADRNHPKEGYEAMLEFLSCHEAPDAVFCQNDLLAIGCYHALRERCLRIPEDVAVVGCDCIEIGEFLDPTLSTIQQPVDEMCTVSWEFLKRRMSDPELPRQCAALKGRFIKRQSC
jgi:DNA-binding LacI/PurR family transcriptional regulator